MASAVAGYEGAIMNTTCENPAGSSVNTAPRTAAEIAASVLGEIEWTSPTMGYCECPGKKSHGSKDGAKDCAVYLDRVPTVSYFHGSCKPAVETANKRLRAAVLNPTGDASFEMRRPTPEDRARLVERELKSRMQLRARKALPSILKKYRWPYAEMLNASPMNVRGNEADHWKLLLAKFEPDDVVWIGERSDSGSYLNCVNFKTVAEWLKLEFAPNVFVCPSVFKNNTMSRSNENVLERRFLVVESDLLSRDEVGSVFRYLVDCGLKLVAVVDTAGKSLHGWFEFPADEELMNDLRLILPALKCDPKMLTASQPARLPGAMRGEQRQRLIFLAKEEVDVNEAK
jgi:hypothetical protein